MKHESVVTEFVEANGLRFEVDKCGSGDTLVMCLHGFPEHAISWRFQMPMLADMGYTVWAPNQRGYGRSDIPKGIANYSIDKLTEDIGALFDASGCKDMILMGHDWGAGIAWSFAIGQVRPLQRLVIANVPHPNALRRELADNKEQKKKSWYIAAFQIPWLPEFVMRRRDAKAVVDAILNTSVNKDNFPPEVVEIYRQNALRKGGLTGMINYYRAAVRSGGLGQGGETLPIIETPTLMLWGEQDLALTKQSTFGTDEWVADLTLRYLPGASHWVQQDAPLAFNAALKAWLRDEPLPTEAADSAINPQ
jgi:pimeloyl-ACP methyl ester carboxylesterase